MTVLNKFNDLSLIKASPSLTSFGKTPFASNTGWYNTILLFLTIAAKLDMKVQKGATIKGETENEWAMAFSFVRQLFLNKAQGHLNVVPLEVCSQSIVLRRLRHGLLTYWTRTQRCVQEIPLNPDEASRLQPSST